MNTAKKRILSLTLTICLALSMMLTLSACGKKNLEEYFNTDTMQKLVTSSIEQYESQGMELKMYAEGDELHYDLTLTTIETTDDDRSVYAEALEAGLAENRPDLGRRQGRAEVRFNETVLVVVTYFDAAGVEQPPSPSPLRTEPGTHRGSCTGAAPFFAPKRGADSRQLPFCSSFSPDTPPPDRRL